jgi:hypothetical protein
MPLRTRIDNIEPRQVLLTQAGRARVRVQGFTLGFVSCAGQRRAVWGQFDESFVVTCKKPALTISAFGLGGRARQQLRVRQAADLIPPAAPELLKLRFLPFSLPGVLPLTSQLLTAIADNAGSELRAASQLDEGHELPAEREPT